MEIRDKKLEPYYLKPDAEGNIRVYKHIPSKEKEKGGVKGATVAYDRFIGKYVDMWTALHHVVNCKVAEKDLTLNLLEYMQELRELRAYIRVVAAEDFELMRRRLIQMEADVKFLKERNIKGVPMLKF